MVCVCVCVKWSRVLQSVSFSERTGYIRDGGVNYNFNKEMLQVAF